MRNNLQTIEHLLDYNFRSLSPRVQAMLCTIVGKRQIINPYSKKNVAVTPIPNISTK